MFNKAYCEFLDVKQEDVLGRKVQDVIENTRMHVVLQTGRPEIGEVQRIKGHDMICSRVPLKRDGKVWGAVGTVMFRDVAELRTLMKRVDRLQTELEYYKGELKRHQGSSYSLDNIIGESPRMRGKDDSAWHCQMLIDNYLVLDTLPFWEGFFFSGTPEGFPLCRKKQNFSFFRHFKPLV